MKWVGLALLLLIHLLVLNNLTFTAWPEMLSYPFLLSHNFSLYKDFIMPYPPLLVLILKTVFEIFGYSVETLKILTWFLILILDVIIFLTLTRLTTKRVIIFFFLTIFVLLQSFLDGNMLWFDFATVIPVCLAFLFSIKWVNSKKNINLYLVGLMLGIAVLIKQIAIVYIGSFFIFLLLCSFKKIVVNTFICKAKSLLILGLGVLTIVLPFFLYLLTSQSLVYFWNWTIYYPLVWWSKFPGYVDFEISRGWILITLLLLSPLVGLVPRIKDLFKKPILLLNLLLLIAAILAIYPRFSFFHLQPTIALAVSLYAQTLLMFKSNLRKVYLILISVCVLVIVSLTYPHQVGRSIRFFEESQKQLSHKITSIVGNDKSVYLLGPISSQYVFTKTLPPKNWSDNFGWYLEIPGVQEWVLAGLREDKPQYIFRQTPQNGLWYELGTYQPKKIVEYIYQNYDKQELFNSVEIWKRKN